MTIDDKLMDAALSYKIYLEKKKALELEEKILNNDLNSVCSHFTCNNCPVLNMCVKLGRNVKSVNRWENIETAKNTIKCANCGHIRELKHFSEIIKRPKFCEMCGVKMDESEGGSNEK